MTAKSQVSQGPPNEAAQRSYSAYVQLHRSGRELEGRPYLRQAADGGHPSALFRLALINLEGSPHERDVSAGVTYLSTAASLGHVLSRHALAVLKAKGIGFRTDWQGAVDDVIALARSGEARALRDLGLLLQMRDRGHPLSNDLLFQAACLDDAVAAHLILMRIEAGLYQAPPGFIAFWTHALRRLGHPRAFRLPQAAAEPQRPPVPEPLENEVVTEIQALLQVAPIEAAGVQARPLSERPKLVELRGLLSAEECEFLIGFSAPLQRDAEVYNNVTGKPEKDPVRTCSEAVLWPSNQALAVHCLESRMAAAANTRVEHGEHLRILKYLPGQEFRPHFDYFSNVEMVPDFAQSGQRERTLLTYLNDDYTGGETHFLTAGRKVRGNTGDAILFYNTDDSGVPDPATLHAGLPVIQGTKWLGSKWFRQRDCAG